VGTKLIQKFAFVLIITMVTACAASEPVPPIYVGTHYKLSAAAYSRDGLRTAVANDRS
jgi:hypothetical protein